MVCKRCGRPATSYQLSSYKLISYSGGTKSLCKSCVDDLPKNENGEHCVYCDDFATYYLEEEITIPNTDESAYVPVEKDPLLCKKHIDTFLAK